MFRLSILAPLALLLCAAQLSAVPLITEFMASNDSVLYDEDGDSSDWIEIHNPDSEAHDLGGYFLTNDAGTLRNGGCPR